jgi:glycosyltransferase involved in cell wall biosynthesis
MYPQLRSKAYFCCVYGIKTHSLTEILDYLVELIRKEREWKTDLYRYGHTDMAMVRRLIEEVERGTRDGVHDAFAKSSRQGIDEELLLATKDAAFKKFPLPLPREQRLRICFVSQDYPPVGHGGIGQWTREMAIGFARRGHEITVICRSETDYPHIDFVDGVWVHRIITRPHALSTKPEYAPAPHSLLHYSACVFDEIMRVQQHRQFQLICGPIFDFEPLVAMRESGIPTIFSLHTTYKLGLPHKPDWLNNEEYRRGHVETAIAKEKEILQTAPFMESNTRTLLEDLESAYDIKIDRERAIVIRRGLDDLSRQVEPFPVRPGMIRVLFVGRLELRKGADILLEALPELLNRYPNLEIDIVGDDKVQIEGTTLREAFERTSGKNGIDISRVTFHGAVSRENLLRHYATCDIFVAPSRYESFGLIFVEAMIFGKPSVGIAVGGAVEVVTDGVDGLLIESDDADLLAGRIAMLIDNPSLRKKLGAAARHTYESRFSLQRMLDESEAYYSNVIRSHARPRSRVPEEVHS